MLGKLDNELAFVQNALNLRAKRQEILAANIANADTPDYKAKDIDFNAALRRAMGDGKPPMQMSRTAANHLDGRVLGVGDANVKFRSSVQPSLDGNTVDPDVERAHFSENVVHYQFLLERARGTFRTLSMALEPAR